MSIASKVSIRLLTFSGGRIRLRVRWGRKGRSSGGNPAPCAASSHTPARRSRSLDPCSTPTHITVARLAFGNAPRPPNLTLNRCPRSAELSKPRKRSYATSSTWPRKRSVRCQFSGGATLPGISMLDNRSANAIRISVGSGTAANTRLRGPTTGRSDRVVSVEALLSSRRRGPAPGLPGSASPWLARRLASPRRSQSCRPASPWDPDRPTP